MNRTTASLLFSLLLVTTVAFGQSKKPLTNDDVVQVTKAGFDEAIITKGVQAKHPGIYADRNRNGPFRPGR